LLAAVPAADQVLLLQLAVAAAPAVTEKDLILKFLPEFNIQ
jgi:hypothetical protein